MSGANHPTPEKEICAWSRDEDGNDDTECGQTWSLNDGTPTDNGMKFCPYCGRQIVWTDYVEETDDG